jgi:transcriptional regulator with XRE-family HTH domain
VESVRCIGVRIGAIRRRRGLTQAELAGQIGRTANSVSALERGRNQPTLDTLRVLAAALGVPMRDFLAPAGEAGTESPKRAALFSELLDTARSLPLAELEMTVEIVGVVARRHGGA